ncbi:telomerase reverse transcriptase-like [Palaemon carinicauda]|uniref:telomerase reverse transcriptase-like n=1 Tax=Palaemon carinicauda TaxID=392227 RepID=UPI0035B5D6AD
METWGSKENFKVMKQKIRYILRSGIKDTIYLGRLLENFKILSFKWAASFENHMMKTHTISKVILWVIEKIAFTLVKGYFYVTEGRVTRYQMIFFLKRDFRKIHQDGVSFMKSTGALKLLNRKTALKIAEDQSKYGNCSLPPKLRFLPKGLDGVRPLIRSQSLISKMLLLKARLVLQECSSRFSVGVTLKSAKCFVRAWEDYINIVKTLDNKVYIVKVDIADAYGSIMHSKLLEILDKCMHTFPRNIYYDPYEPYRGPSTKTRRKLYVRLDENRQPMTQLEDNSHNKLVKVGSTIEIDTSEVFSKFELMIRGQIVRVGRKRYVLRKGVPQGGYMSPFLCDVYYSALCQEYLGNYIDETSLLLRSVDDILYATSSHEKAESFLRLMNDGMKDYDVSLNTNKTKHNLMGPTRICFNGVIICSDTLQVLVDVASVMACYPRYTMRFNRYKNPGKLFAERVHQVTFARLKILVINPVYTNVSGLISNLWRTSLMSGIRILALIDWLLVPKKTVNIKFICKTVVRVSKKVWSRIHGTWKGSNKVGQITSELVRIVFIGGILSIWKLPKLPTHPGIYSQLYGHVVKLLKALPREYYCLLPSFFRNALALK